MKKIQNVFIGGLDMSDYPKFCDAYFEYAEDENGNPLTEAELDDLADDHDIYEYINDQIHQHKKLNQLFTCAFLYGTNNTSKGDTQWKF